MSIPGWSVGVCSGAPHTSDVLLDRDANQRAVLRPRTVVVLHVRMPEQFVQREPGVAGPLTDAAVRDGVAAVVESFAGVQLAQFVVGPEGAVLVGRLGPRHVDRRGDVTAALALLLRQVGRRPQLAGELVRRAHVDEILRADRGDDLVAERANRGVLLLALIRGLLPRDGVLRQL